MLHQFTEGSVRLPRSLKSADAGQVQVIPLNNARDFIFLGQTEDILEQLGCIHNLPDPETVGAAKQK